LVNLIEHAQQLSASIALQAQQREQGDIPTGHALHDERGVTTVKLFLDKIQGNTSHDGLRTFLLIDVRTRARLSVRGRGPHYLPLTSFLAGRSVHDRG